MNKIIVYFCILVFCFACDTLIQSEFDTSATIYLINETSAVVKSDVELGYIIQPNDTLIHIDTFRYETDTNQEPTIDTYSPFGRPLQFVYEDTTKCEYGMNNIKNYENRKEVGEYKFEFTFRFTEERKAKARPCYIRTP